MNETQKVLPTMPVSDLAHNRTEVLDLADKGPVVLAQRSKARSVIVGVEQWNHMQDVLAMYRAYVRAESARVNKDMEGQEWIKADDYLDQLAEIHGVGERVSA